MKLPTLLLSLLVTASIAAAATDYEIHLNRPATVGERYHAVATGSDEQTALATVDGQPMPPRSERLRVELVADCEVLAVTPKGQEAKIKLVIEKLVRTDAPQPAELLPAGSIVIAESTGERTTFTIEGTPVTRQVAKALETLGVNVRNDEKTSEDTIFGSTERKKVGDSWPINAEAAAKDLAKTGMPATAANLTGSTTLVEVIQMDGQPVLRLAAQTVISGVSPPLPPGVEVKKSSFKADFSGLFPVDQTKPHPQESQSMAIEITAGGTQNGRTMEMSMTKKTTRETKFSRK